MTQATATISITRNVALGILLTLLCRVLKFSRAECHYAGWHYASLSYKLTNRTNRLECNFFIWLGRLARDKHPSLLGPFLSYEENEVL